MALPLIFDAHGKRALEALRRIDDILRNLAPDNPFLRRVAHLELPSGNLRGRNNLKIGNWHEVPDFQFALADNGQRRRLYTTDPDHPASALTQDDGRGACERQVVDLIGLPARDGRSVKLGVLGIWPCPVERLADCLRVLCGEQHPQDLATVIIMLENFLPDQLTFPVAVGGKPNLLGGAQGFANSSELRGFVAALCRPSTVKAFRAAAGPVTSASIPAPHLAARADRTDDPRPGERRRSENQRQRGRPSPGWSSP